MWSSIHLSVRPVWEEAEYVVTATWREDSHTQAVTLTRSGHAQVHTHDDPLQLLQAVVGALAASIAPAPE